MANYRRKGIDISYWQGKVSVNSFKQAKKDGVDFVIVRLGYNTPCNLDSTFENNYKNAKEAGLKVGVYYYSTATTTLAAKKEAAFCIKHLKGKKLDMPVFIDMEDNTTQGRLSSKKNAEICKAFCNKIISAGYMAGLYASLSWLNSKIADLNDNRIDIWVAQYNSICNYKGKHVMWQYTSGANIKGFGGRVDANYCYKDYSRVKKEKQTVKIKAKTKYPGDFPAIPKNNGYTKGDTGLNIKNIQKFLNWYYKGKYNIKVDGIFGEETLKMVKIFQKEKKLAVDGIFGLKTLTAAKKAEK